MQQAAENITERAIKPATKSDPNMVTPSETSEKRKKLSQLPSINGEMSLGLVRRVGDTASSKFHSA